MRGIAVIVFALAAAGVAWFVMQKDPEPRTEDPREESGAESTLDPKPRALTGSPPDSAAEKKKALDTGSKGESLPVPKGPVAADPHVRFAERVGVDVKTAAKIKQWHHDTLNNHDGKAHMVMDDEDGAMAAKRFNAEMKKRREALVQMVGTASANLALNELPVYEFDSTGSWYRVDASGQKIPFEDPKKEDMFRSFRQRTDR